MLSICIIKHVVVCSGVYIYIYIYSETCLLRPLKGLCQVVLIEQVVFIARLSNLTLTSEFFFMIKTFILLSYYTKAMLKLNLNTLENY